jgi:hypothetical protein
VPIVGASFDLLTHVERYAEGTSGLLFRPWANTRRDLNEACARAGKAALSAHLAATKQTYAALTKSQQAALQARFAFPPYRPTISAAPTQPGSADTAPKPHLIAVALGHTDSRMAERVYGRMPVESLGRMLAERVGDCSAFVANTRSAERPVQHIGQLERADFPVNVVPRDRIRTADTRIFNPHLGVAKSAKARWDWVS